MSLQEEYQAAKKACGFADVSRWGKLIFTGTDRQKFLQGLLTNDVNNLAAGRGFPACILTPKGQLVADLALYNRKDDFIALQSPKATAALAQALQKSIILSNCKMEDATGRHLYLPFFVTGYETQQTTGI